MGRWCEDKGFDGDRKPIGLQKSMANVVVGSVEVVVGAELFEPVVERLSWKMDGMEESRS